MLSEYDLDFSMIEFPACERCSTRMVWEECDACEDGLVPGGNDEPVPCPVCDGDAGYWICPHESEHTLPLFPDV